MAPPRGSGAIRKRDRFDHDRDRQVVSAENVASLGRLGVREVGLAPRGRTAWAVKGRVKEQLIRERTLVEGSIGTIKGQKYCFDHPAARSAAMMGVCGQRAVLGFNLTKLVRGIDERHLCRASEGDDSGHPLE